jgi:hypothetical protein
MRKAFIVLLIACLGHNTFAQSWMDIGIKGGWGLNFLYSKNLLDDPDFNERFSSGYSFGGKLGWNFNDFHELTLDVMYYRFNQNYKYNVTDSTTGASPQYDRGISFSGMQFSLLYRHNNDGRYVEIGPTYSTISKMTMTDSRFEVIDGFADDYASSGYMGLAFGFGGYVMGTDNFGITMGVRFNYALGDAFKDDGTPYQFPSFNKYDAYRASHPLTIQLMVEANFDFAYMAKAKCKNKRKLILF